MVVELLVDGYVVQIECQEVIQCGFGVVVQ